MLGGRYPEDKRLGKTRSLADYARMIKSFPLRTALVATLAGVYCGLVACCAAIFAGASGTGITYSIVVGSAVGCSTAIGLYRACNRNSLLHADLENLPSISRLLPPIVSGIKAGLVVSLLGIPAVVVLCSAVCVGAALCLAPVAGVRKAAAVFAEAWGYGVFLSGCYTVSTVYFALVVALWHKLFIAGQLLQFRKGDKGKEHTSEG